MTVNYKGMDKDFEYRLAEINFDDEKEQNLFDKICKVMNIQGWELDEITCGYASCKVENMDEYKDFVKDYKEVKKAAKLWIKFGI